MNPYHFGTNHALVLQLFLQLENTNPLLYKASINRFLLENGGHALTNQVAKSMAFSPENNVLENEKALNELIQTNPIHLN